MSLKLTVLKTRQPIGEFFIASIKAKDLVDISYSDVRRLAEEQRDVERYLGIQRPVSTKRIKEIKKYIQADDSTFPTSVILAVDEKCAEYKEINDHLGELTLSEFKAEDSNEVDVKYSRIAKVIDGQHRIAAFMDEGHSWSFDYDERDFDINVAIFIGADLSEQANIFATVNLAQTKVNKSLVYDLTELAKTPSPHKTCHNVAVVLDKEKSSPLHYRIKRLGTATPGRRNEPLTQASFVESLVKFLSPDPVLDRNTSLAGKKVQRAGIDELIKFPFRNLFIDGKDLDIVEILYNYFKAIEQKWPESWAAVGRVGNLLPRSNAFKAFMIYLREDIYINLVDGDFGAIPTVEEFEDALSHIELQDEDFSTRNFAPGSGGQSTFLKILRGQLSLEDIVED
jgi:DGQHR domain-containing protein